MMTAGELLMAVGALLLCETASAQSLTGSEVRITSNAADQYAPSLSGNIVSYTDSRGQDLDIYYFDLATQTEHPVGTAPGNQEMSRVSDGLVTYLDVDQRHILVYDARTGATVDATSPGASALDSAIGQRLVAWADDRSGDLEIFARDLAGGEERRVTFSPESDDRPAVDRGVIVWQRCSSVCDIWAYDWASGEIRQITNTPERDERVPAIEGSWIVYEGLENGDRDIYAFDLAGGEERRLALPANQRRPRVSGDFAAFDDLSTGVYHIGLWSIASGQVFSLTGGFSGQYLNDIDGNRVVYTDDRDGQLDIYLFEFQFTHASANAVDCAHLNGAQPLLDVSLERSGEAPALRAFSFRAPAGPGLLCIENGAGGTPPVSTGLMVLDGWPVVWPSDWRQGHGWFGWWARERRSHLERRTTLGPSNVLFAWICGGPGATARARIYSAAPPHPECGSAAPQAAPRGQTKRCRSTFDSLGSGAAGLRSIEALAPPPNHRRALAALDTTRLAGAAGSAALGSGGCSQLSSTVPPSETLLALAAFLGGQSFGRARRRGRG